MPEYKVVDMAQRMKIGSLKERIYGTIEFILGWGILLAIPVFFLGLVWKMPAMLFFIPVVVLLYARRSRLEKIHFEKLLNNRTKDSICTFSRHFDCRDVDTWVIRAVYEQLQTLVAYKDFPVLPCDDVFKDLLIDEDDFDFDLVEEIAERTGRSFKNMKENPYYGKAHIVENLVFFFNHQPQIIAD